MSVIDLDRPPTVTPPPARRRLSRRMLVSLAILLVGAALGSTATWSYLGNREDRAWNSHVSVVVLPDTGPQANDAGFGGVVVNDKVVDASLSRQITLVNAGPLPVNVHDFTVVRPGLTAEGVAKQRWVQPGQSVRADADVRITCAEGLPIGQLTVRLDVETYDEQERTATAVLDAREWNDQARVACDGDLS
jgi:hypothetical protein